MLVAVLLLAGGTPCPSVELRAQLDSVPLAARGCWQPTPVIRPLARVVRAA